MYDVFKTPSQRINQLLSGTNISRIVFHSQLQKRDYRVFSLQLRFGAIAPVNQVLKLRKPSRAAEHTVLHASIERRKYYSLE